MRKIWIASGWVLYVAGAVMVMTMGLAWLGEGKPRYEMISGIAMGCLFILLGHNFVARGRSLPIYTPSRDSETAGNDQIAARRMVAQAIWIAALIVVAVGLVVGLLLLLTGKSAGYPAERTAIISSKEVQAHRRVFSILPGSPAPCLPVDR